MRCDQYIVSPQKPVSTTASVIGYESGFRSLPKTDYQRSLNPVERRTFAFGLALQSEHFRQVNVVDKISYTETYLVSLGISCLARQFAIGTTSDFSTFLASWMTNLLTNRTISAHVD